ncbi:MAG: hypothetical protein JWO77_1374, partial [Ilumatobacteraceae bacterium]|nr:hypothetical protein [Ilumatobacteraceae bacterium]
LGIDGNADQPRNSPDSIVFTDRWGRPLNPTGQPVPPAPPQPGTAPAEHVAATASAIGITAAPYAGPTGERLDRWGFHLQADPPHPTDTADHAPDDDPEPPPQVSGRRPAAAPAEPCGPLGGAPIDPPRAGPAHA